MTSLPGSQHILQAYGGQIRFIRAIEDGAPCWFYLRLHADRQADFDHMLPAGSLDIRDYGEILESDLGHYPPAEVVRFMQDTYGFLTPEQQ